MGVGYVSADDAAVFLCVYSLLCINMCINAPPALLLAARNADARMISTLMDAGAARQLWKGYHQQVCNALDANPNLSDSERAGFKQPLCKEVYQPLPVSQQKPVDIRAGDILPLRDDGVIYEISLLQRPERQSLCRRLRSRNRR